MKSNQKQKVICRIILVLFTSSLVFGLNLYDIKLDRANISEKYLINTSLDENSITIGYDLPKKTEILGDKHTTNLNLYHEDYVAPYLGNLQEDTLQLSYPFPPDDRVKVVDTTAYPWRTICKLYITAADETQFIGSGTMLDEYHVLTCGHCVYLHDYGGWASEVKVVPGMAGSYEPFGHSFATYYRSYIGWIESEMVEHDWAVITLDSTIGSQTGWMGRMTADPSDLVYTGTLNIAGYPGDLDFGEYMYFDSDVGEDADEYNHWFWMDTAGGQSGSPVWMYDGDNRYIVSIFTYEYEYGTYANFGTRLNQDKYDRINIWVAEDTPPNDGNSDNNLNYMIPIIITIVVIALIGITIIVLIKRKSVRETEALEVTDISPQIYQEDSLHPELSQTTLEKVKFCAMCGKPILRETQKFCSDCGFSLKDELE